MRFRFLDTNLFFLPGAGTRFVHIASIEYGVREFMLFVDSLTEKMYLEEITGGHLEQITDNQLLDDLEKFVTAANLLRPRPWNLFINQAKKEANG